LKWFSLILSCSKKLFSSHSFFFRIDALIHKTALQVSAGFYHTLVLTGSPDDEGLSSFHTFSGSDGSLNNSSSIFHPNSGGNGERNSLSTDLGKLLNNPARSDVTFMVEGRPIHAHRCVIMCRWYVSPSLSLSLSPTHSVCVCVCVCPLARPSTPFPISFCTLIITVVF
jgi:hypothetical protein